MGSEAIVAVTAIVFGFVYLIVKMGIEHSEKLERMKHGYPLKDGSTKMEGRAEIIDYRPSQPKNDSQFGN